MLEIKSDLLLVNIFCYHDIKQITYPQLREIRSIIEDKLPNVYVNIIRDSIYNASYLLRNNLNQTNTEIQLITPFEKNLNYEYNWIYDNIPNNFRMKFETIIREFNFKGI